MTEAYIYDHVRSPRGRGKPDGSLHAITPINLASQVLSQLRDRNNLDTSLIDEIVQIDGDDAGIMARRLAKEEGILCGISAGGNVHAAVQLAKKPENEGKLIVTVICDTGERYLSTWLFEDK